MAQKSDALEVTTRVMRGALRYRNQGTIRVIALLVATLDEAAQILAADHESLGAMCIVDPEFEHLWAERSIERGLVLDDVTNAVRLLRQATEIAKQELQLEQGPTHERQAYSSGDQGPDQPR